MGLFILLLISPLLSLPFILLKIRERSKVAVFIFAIFLGTIAYCTIPYQDLFRHLMHYEAISKYKNITDVSSFDFEMNGILVYIYWILSKLSIPFDYIRLIAIPIGYYLLFIIFYEKTKSSVIKYSNKEYFVRFLILTFFFDLFYTIEGARYGVALCFYLYGLFQLFEKNNRAKCILMLVLASLYHSSFMYFSIISFIIYNAKISKNKAIIYTIIAFICMTLFFKYFGYILGTRADWYLNKTSGSTAYSSMTFYGIVGFFLPKLCVVPFSVLLLKYFTPKSKWMKMGLVWLILSIVGLSNAVFFYRIWWVFMALGIYMFIDYEKFFGKNNHKSYRFLTASILFALSSLIPMHSILMKSNYEKLFMPYPIILEHTYNSAEILKEYPYAGKLINSDN